MIHLIKIMLKSKRFYIILSFLILVLTNFATCSRLESVTKDRERIKENFESKINEVELKYSVVNLKFKEFDQYLKARDAQLLAKINKQGIKPNKVERIITNNVHYVNNDTLKVDLEDIKKAVLNDYKAEKLVSYTDSCLIVKGVVKYDNNTLSFDLIDKEFKNKTDVVVYTERKQWKFLFIRSKLFGKKYSTAKVFNECGESYTTEVNVVN